MIKKFVLSVVFTFSIVFLSACDVGGGKQTGYITAIDTSGVIWKNYRVYIKSDMSSSQEDVYCLEADEKDLVDKLYEMSKNKEFVSIEYDENFYVLPFGKCSGEAITGAYVIGKDSNPSN